MVQKVQIMGYDENTGKEVVINVVDGKLSVDASTSTTLPLPTGAATSAKQDTGNSSLTSIDGKLGASAIGEYNVTLTVVDTEYSQALPANTKGIEFMSRGGYPVRFAFTAGKVATPTGVYFTLKSNCVYESPAGLNLSSKTIYFASDNAGDVVEMIAWS